MFSLDAPLQPAIESFINPEHDDTIHKTSLNTVVLQVHRKIAIESLIQMLGTYLTHTDDKVRTRATLLLAEVLTRLPELTLTSNAVQLLMNFFTDRLADFPSATACLQALIALETHHTSKMTSSDITIDMIAKLVKVLHVPQLTQAMRKQCYLLIQLALDQPQVVETLINRTQDSELKQGRVFIQAFLNSMEGEKDPRNLLLCLDIARDLLVKLSSVFELYETDLQHHFEIISCYFPITFTPPPNDPYGITSEDLIRSLRRALSASDLLARHVLPFLLEKLNATVTEAKVDSIETLVFCAETYSMQVMLLHLHSMATALYHEVLKGEKKQVIEIALHAITRLAGIIAMAQTQGQSIPALGQGGTTYAWNKFVVELTNRAIDDLRSNAVDSLVSESAGHILAALGKDSVLGFSLVVEKAGSLLMEQLEESAQGTSASKVEAALHRLLLLVNTINREVDQSSPDAQPIRAPAPRLMTLLSSFLQPSKSEEMSPTTKRLAIEALSHLVTYPPSPVLEPTHVQSLIALFTHALLYNETRDVRLSALASLKEISTLRQKTTGALYATFVVESCVSKLMDVINMDPHESPIMMVQDMLSRSKRTHDELIRDVLQSITELCRQPSIFRATVVRLVTLCIETEEHDVPVFHTIDENQEHHHVAEILEAVATIVEMNATEKEWMEFCCVDVEGSISLPIVRQLLTVVTNTAHVIVRTAQEKSIKVPTLVDQRALPSCIRIFRTTMQNVSIPTQQQLMNECIRLFLETKEPRLPAYVQLVPLFAAVINSAHREVVVLQHTLVIDHLVECAQWTKLEGEEANPQLDTIYQQSTVSASKSLASIINKTQEGPDLDILLTRLLDNTLSKTILNHQGHAAARVVALELYVWIAKALVIRGHKQHAPSCLSFLSGLLTLPPSGNISVIQMHVAKRFKLLVNEDDEVLNRKCGATVMFLYRQRMFEFIFPRLLEFIQNENRKRVDAMAALVAMSHMIASAPKALVTPHLGVIFPLMVHAINTDDVDVASSAIPTFRMLLFESIDSVKPFLKEVFPGLLKQAVRGAGALERRDALECLSKLATLPYELIHPYKDTVLKQLALSLDDRKKFVRHVAVRVRNQWSVL